LALLALYQYYAYHHYAGCSFTAGWLLAINATLSLRLPVVGYAGHIFHYVGELADAIRH